jgi:hypothetical protein
MHSRPTNSARRVARPHSTRNAPPHKFTLIRRPFGSTDTPVGALYFRVKFTIAFDAVVRLKDLSAAYFRAAGFAGKFAKRKLKIRFSYPRFASSGIPA